MRGRYTLHCNWPNGKIYTRLSLVILLYVVILQQSDVTQMPPGSRNGREVVAKWSQSGRKNGPVFRGFSVPVVAHIPVSCSSPSWMAWIFNESCVCPIVNIVYAIGYVLHICTAHVEGQSAVVRMYMLRTCYYANVMITHMRYTCGMGKCRYDRNCTRNRNIYRRRN